MKAKALFFFFSISLAFFCNAQFVGPAPLVVPGNSYAFQFSPSGTIGGLTPFGLYLQGSTANPGFEFRGTGGNRLVTIQSAALGERDPGDLTFGNTGAVIINPNRYAFRFSLTKEYGLFFNAAQRYYQFLNGVDQGGNVGAPVFSIQADNGNVGIGILPTTTDKLLAFRKINDFGPGKSAVTGYRVGGSGVAVNGGIGWSVTEVDAAVKGYSEWGNQFSASVYGGGTLNYPQSAVVMGYHTNDQWGALGYRDNNQVWSGFFRGEVHVQGSAGAGTTVTMGGPVAAIRTNAPVRVDYTRQSSSPFVWPRMNLIIDNLNYGVFPGLALVARSDSAAGGILFGVPAGGFNVGSADGIDFRPINASAFNVSSDRTLKKEITYITKENNEPFLRHLRNIEPATFRYLNENVETRPVKHIGVIAQSLPQEVQARITETSGGSNQTQKLGVSLADLSGLMMIGIQSIDQRQEEMAIENTALKEQLDALQTEVRQLKKVVQRMDSDMAKCCEPGSPKEDRKSERAISHPDKRPRLEQNTPNPFDGSTTIRYFVPDEMNHAVLKVFNLEGKEVQSFSLEKGTGEVIFKTNLNSGAYFYSLLHDGKVIDTKQMIRK